MADWSWIGFGLASVIVVFLVFVASTFVVQPREAHVLLYWGKLHRTVVDPGFNFAFPLGLSRRVVPTRDVAFSTPLTTVVEANGNPIQVSAVVVYRVVDAAKALIDVQGYQEFVVAQASSALKMVCSRFPYESRSRDEPSLKHESPEILGALAQQLQSQVYGSGVQVLLVRLNDLTYAPEIAPSMLLRQQAQALVDARRTLVAGAVATAKEAIDRLEARGVRMAPGSRAQLAYNLTLLLCAGDRGEHHATVVARPRA